MAKFGLVLDHLRRLLHRDTVSSDWELLRRFTEEKDEAAFSALIERYGRLVMGIGLRVLRNEHDAEDVFQAVFGILARKASTLDRRAALSTWLHTVAFNLALNAKKRSTMRREREKEAASMAEQQSSTDAWEEIRPLLDAELERLPDSYRIPLTLTYLLGKTTEEAALEIGCSPDAVRGRLARGRELLRNRLVKKGVTISSTLLGTALAENAASASVSVGCAASALQVALVVVGRGTGVLSPTVSALIQEGVRQMFVSKLKMVAVVLVAVLVVGVGAGFVAQKVLAGKEQDAESKKKQNEGDRKSVPVIGDLQNGQPGLARKTSVFRSRQEMEQAFAEDVKAKLARGDKLPPSRVSYYSQPGNRLQVRDIDFEKEMVIAVYGGAGTTHEAFKIVGVYEVNGKLLIEHKKDSTIGGAAPMPAVLYHAVVVKKSDLKPEFKAVPGTTINDILKKSDGKLPPSAAPDR